MTAHRCRVYVRRQIWRADCVGCDQMFMGEDWPDVLELANWHVVLRMPLSPSNRLRLAAAGQREYAAGMANLAVPRQIEAHEELELVAAVLDRAALIADGDDGPLYNLLPSWRWTAEMHKALNGGAS